MGFRMNISPKGQVEKSVGDDHKLYAYQSFDDVGNSFSYLYLCTKGQDTHIHTHDNPRDAYDIMCSIGSTGIFELTAEQFEVFCGLYLSDFARCRPDDVKLFKQIEHYMHDMCIVNGNKWLWWED